MGDGFRLTKRKKKQIMNEISLEISFSLLSYYSNSITEASDYRIVSMFWRKIYRKIKNLYMIMI